MNNYMHFFVKWHSLIFLLLALDYVDHPPYRYKLNVAEVFIWQI